MDTAAVVALVKARLGIMTAVRDTYLTAIVDGVISELEDEKGVVLVDDDANHLLFVCDYATWRYQSASSNSQYSATTGAALSMPRHLQYRLHNLIIHSGGAAE